MLRRAVRALATALALAAPLAAPAAVVGDCNTSVAHASNLMFPGSESLRSFANGAIRMLWLDINEPACCSSYLMVVVADPVGMGQSCWLIGANRQQRGFGGFDLRGATASYDPARGLTVSIRANIWQGDGPPPARLDVTVNRSVPSVTVTEQPL